MSKIKVGDKVRFISRDSYRELAQYFPEYGTVGTVLEICGGNFMGQCFVQWPIGSTSGDDRWFASLSALEKEEEEVETNA